MSTIHRSAPSTGTRLAVAWLGVPVLAGALGVLGLGYAQTLRATGSGQDPDLLVAVVAAGACLAVAGWWVGGLVMLALARAARRLRWHGLERWATHLTPALVARTAVALVGVQLVVVAPAHADDAALDPFWAPATAGTEQLAEPSAPAPESVQEAAPDTAPGAQTSGPEATPESTAAPVRAPEASTPMLEPANPPAGQRVSNGVLTVMAGDTLWGLTEQLLGPGATDATVCHNLPAWLELNAVAHQGDLIRPGDQLRVPPHLLDPAGTPHEERCTG